MLIFHKPKKNSNKIVRKIKNFMIGVIIKAKFKLQQIGLNYKQIKRRHTLN